MAPRRSTPIPVTSSQSVAYVFYEGGTPKDLGAAWRLVVTFEHLLERHQWAKGRAGS